MKAEDYYKKYINKLALPMIAKEAESFAFDIYMDFSNEIVDILKTRNTEKIESFIAVIIEQNQKWNALHRQFARVFGDGFIKPDGFINGWKAQMPEMAPAIDAYYRHRL